MHSSAKTLDHALDLLDSGFSLVPLAPRRKRPNLAALRAVHGTERWSVLRGRRATEREVRAWFEIDADAGIGVIVTPGLVIVDIDRPDAVDITHPATPCVRTAKGWHLYFAATVDGVHPTRWGELRGSGSYVVAPPSLHETGHRYRWMLSPREVRLARLPRPLAASAATASSVHRPTANVAGRNDDASARLRHAPSVAAAMTFMGRPDAIDASGRTREVRCLLREHRDRHPSAGLYRSAHGAWRYKCHGCTANLSLAGLYAAVTASSDHARSLTGLTARAWLLRLLHASGIAPVTFDVPELPTNAPEDVRAVAEGFALLAALRGDDHDGPVPFSYRFAAAWCGLSEERAHGATEALRHVGWLRAVDPSHSNAGYLYTSGPVTETWRD